MKTMLLGLYSIAFFLMPNEVHALDLQVTTPASLKVKVYKVAFSLTGDCQNLQTVYERSATDATFIDFLSSPTLAENLSLADGTYNCVAIEMSDLIKFTTTVNDGTCVAGTEYTLDVCASNNSEQTGVLIDGTAITCSATRGTEDRVTLWLSTASTCGNGSETCSAWRKPADATADDANGFNLANAFVKSGSSTGTFVVDATNKVNAEDEESGCGLSPPTFTFR